MTTEDLTFVSAPFARVARTILAVYLLSNTQRRSTPVTYQNYFHIFFTRYEQFQSRFSYLIVFRRKRQSLMKKKALDQRRFSDRLARRFKTLLLASSRFAESFYRRSLEISKTKSEPSIAGSRWIRSQSRATPAIRFSRRVAIDGARRLRLARSGRSIIRYRVTRRSYRYHFSIITGDDSSRVG